MFCRPSSHFPLTHRLSSQLAVDCIQRGPPPLPKPNMEPTRRLNDIGTDAKLAEAQSRAPVTDKTDDTEVVKCSAAQGRPSSLIYPPLTYKPCEKNHESINSLYGLV